MNPPHAGRGSHTTCDTLVCADTKPTVHQSVTTDTHVAPCQEHAHRCRPRTHYPLIWAHTKLGAHQSWENTKHVTHQHGPEKPSTTTAVLRSAQQQAKTSANHKQTPQTHTNHTRTPYKPQATIYKPHQVVTNTHHHKQPSTSQRHTTANNDCAAATKNLSHQIKPTGLGAGAIHDVG